MPRVVRPPDKDGQTVDNRDTWLINWLADKIDNSLNTEEGDVSDVRQYNFNRYYGKLYGNERDGHSKFTTREVFEAVEWAMPSLVRVFTTNKKAVEFVPFNQQDEDQAREESDIVNHYIQVENNGFLTVINWIKDLLMYPNGYAKVVPTEADKVTFEELEGVTDLVLSQIEEDDTLEIIESETYEENYPEFGTVELRRIRVKKTEKVRSIYLASLPPDETLVDDDWEQVDLEGCPFVAHRTRKTLSALILEGYDKDELEALGDVDTNTWNDERVNRLFYEEESPDSREEATEGGGRKLWVHEITALVDYDDDGIEERRRIVMIGDQIFENEEDEYQPIISCASIVIPHKHIGMSYVESVQDLQLYATTITRQMLDNVYSQTNIRHYFNEDRLAKDNSTLDDYLDARSQVILVRGPPSEAVMPEINTPIIQELLGVIGHIKEQPKLRTGVAPELSLDPAVLAQSTKGAFGMALSEASQRLEMLVRIIAELGYKRLVGKVHHLLRTHVKTAVNIKVRGNWVEASPQNWPERTKMTAEVGLGHISDQQKVQLLFQLLSIQKEALPQNLTTFPKIYNTLERLTEAANLGPGAIYFDDPSKPVERVNPETGETEMVPWQPPQPPEPPPDPNMILAQGQVQAMGKEQDRKLFEAEEKAKNEQGKLQASNAKVNQDMQNMLRDLAFEREKFRELNKQFEDKYELDSAAASAEIRNKNADTEVKRATVDKIAGDTRKTDIETSDDVRELNEIISELEKDAEGGEPDDDGEQV